MLTSHVSTNTAFGLTFVGMTDATIPPGQLNIREKLAHIDQMLADHDRKRQEIRYAPWQLFVAFAGPAIGLMTAGAALFAAGAAFIKLLGQ